MPVSTLKKVVILYLSCILNLDLDKSRNAKYPQLITTSNGVNKHEYKPYLQSINDRFPKINGEGYKYIVRNIKQTPTCAYELS